MTGRPAILPFVLFIVVTIVPGGPTSLVAQDEGESTGRAIGGAALGAYSGATLALVGSLVPCNRVIEGRRCVRATAAIGAAVGLVSGAVVGIRDRGELHERVRQSGYGAIAGVLVGFGMRNFIRQYDWADVGAATAVGAAIGASATGAGIGFAAGALPGLLLWKGVGAIGTSDAVALSLAGLALGGLVGWAVAAGRDPNTGPLPLQVTIPVGF